MVGMGGRPAMSDDTGTFRLYGLAPGTYYVSARAEEMGRMGPAVTDATVTGFAPTFYPGTPVAAEAQPIEVVAGAEVVADVSLVAARLTSVSGVVVDPSGARATGGYVMTMQGGRSRGMMFGGGGGGSDQAGRDLHGVRPRPRRVRPAGAALLQRQPDVRRRHRQSPRAAGHRVGHRQRRSDRRPSAGRRGSDSHPGEPDLRGRVRAASGAGVRLRVIAERPWAGRQTPRFATTAGCRWRSFRERTASLRPPDAGGT